jgi:hypothetical protein
MKLQTLWSVTFDHLLLESEREDTTTTHMINVN